MIRIKKIALCLFLLGAIFTCSQITIYADAITDTEYTGRKYMYFSDVDYKQRTYYYEASLIVNEVSDAFYFWFNDPSGRENYLSIYHSSSAHNYYTDEIAITDNNIFMFILSIQNAISFNNSYNFSNWIQNENNPAYKVPQTIVNTNFTENGLMFLVYWQEPFMHIVSMYPFVVKIWNSEEDSYINCVNDYVDTSRNSVYYDKPKKNNELVALNEINTFISAFTGPGWEKENKLFAYLLTMGALICIIRGFAWALGLGRKR